MPDRDPPVLAFASAAAWDAWLGDQPRDSVGVWLKLAKAASGITSVGKAEAIEAALRHGWIDGQLDRFDADHWLIRFTPRRPKSKWSANNRKTALRLIEEGRMAPAGLREVERARADGRWEAAYAPQSTAEVPEDLAAALGACPAAKALFDQLDSPNRYAILYRTGTAKTAATRARKIAEFVAMLERGETIYPRRKAAR